MSTRNPGDWLKSVSQVGWSKSTGALVNHDGELVGYYVGEWTTAESQSVPRTNNVNFISPARQQRRRTTEIYIITNNINFGGYLQKKLKLWVNLATARNVLEYS